MGIQLQTPAVLPTGKTRCPLCRRMGRPQDRCGRMRKISPPPGFDPRTVQPVVSRYTNCTIPAHMVYRYVLNSNGLLHRFTNNKLQYSNNGKSISSSIVKISVCSDMSSCVVNMDTTRSVQTLARMNQTTWCHMAGNSNTDSCSRHHRILRSRPEFKQPFDNYDNYCARFSLITRTRYLSSEFVSSSLPVC